MAAPYDAPIPGAAGQLNAALLAKTAYQNTLARINRERSQTLRQFGYLGDVDETTGTLKNLRVDPNNPYGNLQSMFRSHALAQEQAKFGAEERGLRGGLANKAASDLRYTQGSETANLGTTLTDRFADYQDAQTQAKYEQDRALYEAQLEATRNAIANGDFNPGDMSGGNTSSSDTSTSNTSTSSSGNTTTAQPGSSAYIRAVEQAVANGYGGYVTMPAPQKPVKKPSPYIAAALEAVKAGYGGYVHA